MRSRRLVAATLLVSLLPFMAGCAGEGAASTGLTAAIDTIGGIEHFHYPETGATTLAWRFDTVAVIGGFTEEDPDYQFSRVGRYGLTSDAAGNLYVFDGQGKRIIAYSPIGEFIEKWGREGEGPGEIGSGSGMLAMGPGDTLWLADTSNLRITLFPTDGGEPTSIPLREGNARFNGKLEVVPGGAISRVISFGFTPGEDPKMPPRPLVHIDRDGAITDTLWTVPPAETYLITTRSGNRMTMTMMSRRFSPSFSYGRFSDGGLVTHDQADYDFRLLAPDGTVQRIILRDPLPRATTEEDRQRVIDGMLVQTSGDISEARTKMADKVTFSDVIPRINTLMVDHADRIWVAVSENLPGENERLDVYSRQGELLGELRDVNLPQLFFGDGYAALLTQDDLDVQQILILKLIETP